MVKSYAQPVSILKFGAIGDGKTLNTKAIQQTIDYCSKQGNSRVIIPKGSYLTGSIYLKSGVELYLSAGAVLMGSTRPTDYEKTVNYALILATNQHDISIRGEGIIDGQGRALAQKIVEMWKAGLLKENVGKTRPDEKYRPQIIDFEHCNKVTVKDITIKNSSCWLQTYDKCEGLTINHITINSTAFWNNDGIDIVDCHNARITNCDINSADDGICLKSGDQNASCDQIYIAHCRIRSSASALKFGTASTGGFQHIKVRDLYVYDTYRSAIALECVDGGFIKNIDIQHITAVNTGNGIFIRLGKRRANRPPGSIDSVLIRHVDVQIPSVKPDKGYELEGPIDTERYNVLPSSIIGLPGATPDHITLEDITLHYDGGGKKAYAYRSIDSLQAIPERPAKYPEFSMIGELPAWGLYFRHAGNIKMKNVKLICGSADYRPAIVADDMYALTSEKLTIGETDITSPMIVLKDVKKNKVAKPALPGGVVYELKIIP